MWQCECNFKNKPANQVCGGKGPMGCKKPNPAGAAPAYSGQHSGHAPSPGYGAPPPGYGGPPHLPPGWEQMHDPVKNSPYYCNRWTGESSWTPPSAPGLPPGWEAMPDPRSGKTYFCNRWTGESSWTPPGGMAPPPPPSMGGMPSSYRSSRGRSRSRSPQPGQGGKYTCKLFTHIENDQEFLLGQRIIGRGGCNVKDIVARAGNDVKLRLRGKGSGFMEGTPNAESDEPLQLAVSASSRESFDMAKRLAEDLLDDVHRQYSDYCRQNGITPRAPSPRQSSSGGGTKRSSKAPPPQCDDTDLPTAEEVEDLIEQRNQARLAKDYKRADQIRDDLYKRRVILSDEKKVQGVGHTGNDVTTWRFWDDDAPP